MIYRKKDGSVFSTDKKMLAGEQFVPINGPTKPDGFSHWNTRSSGSGINYFSGQEDRAPLKTNLLHAQHRISKYLFVFFAGIQTDNDHNYDYIHEYIKTKLQKKIPNSEMYSLTLYPFNRNAGDPLRNSDERKTAHTVKVGSYLLPSSKEGTMALEYMPAVIKAYKKRKSIDKIYLIGYSGGGVVSTIVSENIDVTGNITVASPNLYVEKGKEMKTIRLYGEKDYLPFNKKTPDILAFVKIDRSDSETKYVKAKRALIPGLTKTEGFHAAEYFNDINKNYQKTVDMIMKFIE